MKIALTFDDGPEPRWTDSVLRELSRTETTATFFVQAGRAVDHPRQIATMVESGHEIGFHCVEHVRHSEMNVGSIERDVASGLEKLASLDVYPSLWRTPWGDVTDGTRRSAAARSLNLFGWNLDSHDWRGDTADDMFSALEKDGGLEDGSVVLMHDGIGPGARRNGCEQTVRLIPLLIADAEKKGLTPVTASEVLKDVELIRGTE